MRVLLAEKDAEWARGVVAKFFGGEEVVAVESVESAEAALRAGGFDVVLVDYDLEGGVGVDVVKRARELWGAGVAVVAISGHRGGIEAMLVAGADSACAKREVEAQLGEVLAAVLAARS